VKLIGLLSCCGPARFGWPQKPVRAVPLRLWLAFIYRQLQRRPEEEKKKRSKKQTNKQANKQRNKQTNELAN
jgi:hypothetical protein